MSALNADPEGPSRYLRSKGEAEAAIVASGLDWTIFGPSVIFGREDRSSICSRTLDALPAGDGARARATRDSSRCSSATSRIASISASRDDATIGQSYPLCGPNVYTLRELVAFVGELTGRERPIVALPPARRRLQATRPRAPAGHADEPRQPGVDAQSTASAAALSRRSSASSRRRSRRSRPPTSRPTAAKPLRRLPVAGRTLTQRARTGRRPAMNRIARVPQPVRSIASVARSATSCWAGPSAIATGSSSARRRR